MPIGFYYSVGIMLFVAVAGIVFGKLFLPDASEVEPQAEVA